MGVVMGVVYYGLTNQKLLLTIGKEKINSKEKRKGYSGIIEEI